MAPSKARFGTDQESASDEGSEREDGEEDEEPGDLPGAMTFTKTVNRNRNQRVTGLKGKLPDMSEQLYRSISKASEDMPLGEEGEDAELMKHKAARELGDADRAFLTDSLKKSRICHAFGDDNLKAIVDSVQYFEFEAGDTIMKEDTFGNLFFVAESGTFEASVNGNVTQTWQRGGSFGEVALAYGTGRIMTVVAKEKSSCWGADGVVFRRVLRGESHTRLKENREFLNKSSLFDGLQISKKEKVGQLLIITEVFEAGGQVMALGATPAAVYFVKSGLINLIDADGKQVEQLGPGTAMGWRAVLYGEPQMYSTMVEEKCELLALSVSQLTEVLGKDISKFLMKSFLLSVLSAHAAFSRLHTLHRQKIAEHMTLESYPLAAKLPTDYPFGIIVDGKVEGTRNGKPVTLNRGECMEDASFGRLTQEADPSKVDEQDSSHIEDPVSAHRRCKVAVLSRQSLQMALREAGSQISQDMVTPRGLDPHSRAMDYLQNVLMIRKVGLFEDLSCEQIDALVIALELKTHPKGTKVVTEGEVGEAFFIIQSGEVKVEIQGKHIRDLGRRASFGERALIFGEPRSATVTVSTEEATFWSIHRDGFKKCVTQSMRENLAHAIQLKDTTVTLKMLKHKRLIGAGSFGTVRLVEHKKTGLRYALKRIRKKDGKVPAEVQSECNLLSEVKHPFVLTLVCTLETESSIYIVTELLTGGQLHEQVTEKMGVLSRKHSQFYLGSLVLILEALHAQNIVFRDLKPDNVMLDSQGYVKLVDFGLAKKLDPREPKTYTSCGTMLYMAPEVFGAATAGGYGFECDIWSLGIVFFELVCGTYPFGDESESVDDILCSILTKPLEIPARYNDNSGKKLLQGLLMKESDKRLGTGPNGWEDIKDAKFFKQGVSGNLFSQITGRELTAPLCPEGEKYSNERDLMEWGCSLSDDGELGEDEPLDFGCRLLSTFSKFDLDGDGKISKEELRMILQRIDEVTFTDEVIDELVKSIDVDKDDQINYDEFVAWIVNSDAAELRKMLRTACNTVDEI